MNTIEITTLRGNKFIYDSDYNTILPEDLYCREELQQIASRRMVVHQEAGKDQFFQDPRQMSYTQLCLVLTNQCNFRCRYCINSEEYDFSKGFTNEHLTTDIIDRAIDLYGDHFAKMYKWNPTATFMIGFYGGEPLLQYRLIQYAIDKATKQYLQYKPMFTLTTNGYNLTKERAAYLSSHQVHVNVSLDGYKEYHDHNRKTIHGYDTFDRVVSNFREALQVETEGKFNLLMTQDLGFSPQRMYAFFLENPDLDQRIARVNSVADINTDYYDKNPAYPYYFEEFDQLFMLYMEQKKGIREKVNFVHQFFEGSFLDLSKRLQFNNTLCSVCSPLKSRLTVSTDGKLHICEKINENYSIGDVWEGIHYKQAYSYYSRLCGIRQEKCSECAIRNICSLCYVHIQSDGALMQLDDEYCDKAITGVKKALQYYCTMLEEGEGDANDTIPETVCVCE